MSDIVIGAVVMAICARFIVLANRRDTPLGWWRWGNAVVAFVFLAFVLRMTAGFLAEGSPQAAIVMGTSLGAASAVWIAAVFLGARRRRAR